MESKLKQETLENMINDYNNHVSVSNISQKNNIPKSTIYKYLQQTKTVRHGLDVRYASNEEKMHIKELYLSGKSSVEIGKMYGCTHKPILRILEDLGIQRDGKQFARKYKINENYFDEIDTPNKAYCLGFLAADGSNCMSKYTIAMSLEECDCEILEKMRIEMGNEHPLEFIDNSNKHDFGYTYRNQYRMLIFSGHMCKELEKHGVVPNKSLVLQFPDWMDNNLKKHYLRGYIDGDGTYGYKNVESYNLHNKKPLIVSLVSTNKFCLSVQEYLYSELNISAHVGDPIQKNGITSYLTIKPKDTMMFLNWLYEDADLYLKRKYDLYLEYLKYYSNSYVA